MTTKKGPAEGERYRTPVLSLVRVTLGPGSSRITLCESNHAEMKRDEVTWEAAKFAGYQPLGRQLGETRHCPICDSAVVRLVSFTHALVDVLEHLAAQPASEVYVHSAAMLASWAIKNISEVLGISDDPTQPPTSPPAAMMPLPNEPPPTSMMCDWRDFGIQIRERREVAGLTRATLSQLAGVTDSTIRNFETGRHRPNGSTLNRIISVPALRLLESLGSADHLATLRLFYIRTQPCT